MPEPNARKSSIQLQPSIELGTSVSAGLQTHQSDYGFTERPLAPTSDLSYLYQSAAFGDASQQWLSAITRRDRVVLVTGAPGVGKTTLCRSVIEQLDRRTFTSLIGRSVASAEDLVATILIDFGVLSREEAATGCLGDASRGDMWVVFRDFLSSLWRLEAVAVVIIDDAHAVPREVLAYVPSLLQAQGHARVLQVVLVGQPSLETALRRRELHELTEVLSARCVVHGLSDAEVPGYVAARLSSAGVQSRVAFDAAALRRIATLANGVPRNINRLCDRCLMIGFGHGAAVIDEEIIDAAAGDIRMGERMGHAMRRKVAAWWNR
jgi:general secretion pathway protein A